MSGVWHSRLLSIQNACIVQLLYNIRVWLTGAYFGTMVSFPLAGVIADSIGWEWIFYIFGTCLSLCLGFYECHALMNFKI